MCACVAVAAAAFTQRGQCLLSNPDIDVSAVNLYNETALHIGCKQGHLSCVELLASHSTSNLTCKDDDGNTAVHFALSSGHFDCALHLSRLLKHNNLLLVSIFFLLFIF